MTAVPGTRGALVLVGTPIGNLGDLAPRAVETLRGADVIAAEDTRRTRALLSAAGVEAGARLRSLHAHNEARSVAEIVDLVTAGRRVAYVSDAGMPGVSDPGERLVRACAQAGLRVEVVPGPSAALAALVVSGLPAHRFAFEGFLPRKGPARRDCPRAVATSDATVVLFESPHRVAATLADLADAAGPDRPAALARELTKRFEEVVRGPVADLARATSEAPPAGECVIVLGPPAEPAPAVTDDVVEAAVSEALAGGATARDAAVTVSTDLGIGRRRAYEAALRVRAR